jgi:hypothetical protein
MASRRRALVVATYEYGDGGLRRLAAPAHDAESFADVLKDEAIAGFDVTMLVNQPHYVVGEAIADFYGDAGREDLTLLYFSGHGVKDDEGRLYLAMTNTRREALMFTAISGAQLNDAMDASRSRRKVLILDCCYSGAFPAGRTAKADEGVQTLERFQGKGRAVLTASDATQYAFEGDDLRGTGTSSVFTRYLVDAISSGAADLDEDGDIALDELYSYVYERVVAEVPQQRPKKQEDVDGRILIARNVHWTLPAHLQHALESPIAAQRLTAVQELGYLYRAGNDIVRTTVTGCLATLAADDSRSVSSAATALQESIAVDGAPAVTPPVPAPRVPEEAVARSVPVARTPEAPSRVPPAPRAEVEEPPPPVAAPPEPVRPHPGNGTPVTVAPPVAAVLALLVIGGVLLVLSRFTVFDSVTGSTAADIGITTTSWVLGVGLPLVMALLLFIARESAGWTGPLAAGLVIGAVLCVLDQTLGSVAFFASPDNTERPGPAWWLSVAGAALLIGCLALSRETFRGGPPGLRRDWRAVVAAVVVVAALVAWLVAFNGYYVWFAGVESGLLMAAICLPVTLTALSPGQRMAGLAAVTVFAVWLFSFQLHAFAIQTYLLDERSDAVALVCTAASLGACYLAQIRPPRRRRSGPAAEAAVRR